MEPLHDPVGLLEAHHRCADTPWRVGALAVTVRTKVGVRGHPGVDGALVALGEALRRGRVRPAGRALDLTGGPAALPAWAAPAGVASRWTVALGSAAALAAARATLADAAAGAGACPGAAAAAGPGAGPDAGPGAALADLVVALPWELAGPFDWIAWRPPADRGVRRVRAELAAVAGLLAPEGVAVLLQHKDEGAQRAEREAAERFAEVATVGRGGGWRVTTLRGPRPGAAPAPWADFEAPGGGARAVVGAFAADKLDPGTAALLRALGARTDLPGARDGDRPRAPAGARVLDLGCGTGLLARAALAGGAGEVVAVDDDLAAVRSAAAQLAGDPRASVVHADLLRPAEPAGASGTAPLGGFDEVWCNPPFHVGRQVVGALSRAFVAAAHEALRPGGALWLVANRGLPYARELTGWAAHADVTPSGERSFTVWRAQRGR